MKREEAKAEADKIITEILGIVGSNCEHDSYCHEAECNRTKGIIICKVDYEKAKKLAILQVNSNIKIFDDTNGADSRLEDFQSILTELERTK